MTTLRVLLARIRAFVRRGRADAALEDDIQAHLELLTRRLHQPRAFTRRCAGCRTTCVRRCRPDEGDLSRSARLSRHRNIPARPQICRTDPPPRSGVCDRGDRVAGDRDWCVDGRVHRLQRRDAAPAASARPRSTRPAPAPASRRAIHPVQSDLRRDPLASDDPVGRLRRKRHALPENHVRGRIGAGLPAREPCLRELLRGARPHAAHGTAADRAGRRASVSLVGRPLCRGDQLSILGPPLRTGPCRSRADVASQRQNMCDRRDCPAALRDAPDRLRAGRLASFAAADRSETAREPRHGVFLRRHGPPGAGCGDRAGGG